MTFYSVNSAVDIAVIVHVRRSCLLLIGSSSVGSQARHQYLVLIRPLALKRQKMERCSLRSHCHVT